MPRKRTNKQQSTQAHQSQKNVDDKIPQGFTLRHTLRGHSDTIFSVAWSPDGEALASGSNDETIRLWDGKKGLPLRTFVGHSDSVLSVTWSPDGRVLASASNDKTIHLWDGQTGQPLNSLKGHSGCIYSVTWS